VDFLISLTRSETCTLLDVAHTAPVRLTLRWISSLSGVVSAIFDFLGHGLSHDELLHLAGGGHRISVHEFDVTGNLVVSDLSATELAYVIGGNAGVRA
jgi:hypothetical protein